MIMRYFDFKQLMLTVRRINKAFKEFLEKEDELNMFCPNRVLFYKLYKPHKKSDHSGFVYPKKSQYKVA